MIDLYILFFIILIMTCVYLICFCHNRMIYEEVCTRNAYVDYYEHSNIGFYTSDLDRNINI